MWIYWSSPLWTSLVSLWLPLLGRHSAGVGTGTGNNCDVKDLLRLQFWCFWMIRRSQKMIVLAVLRNIWLRLGDYLYWENIHSSISRQTYYTSTYCSNSMYWEMRHPVNKAPYNFRQWHRWSRFHDEIVHQGPRSAGSRREVTLSSGSTLSCHRLVSFLFLIAVWSLFWSGWGGNDSLLCVIWWKWFVLSQFPNRNIIMTKGLANGVTLLCPILASHPSYFERWTRWWQLLAYFN